MTTKSLQAMFAFSVTATVLAGELRAQEAQGTALEEVTVTAQKTSEPLSRVPLAISALRAEDLMKRNYTTMEDFKGAIPGIQVNNYIGEARINIRGIGVNSLSLGIDPQVASSLNGVYTSMLAAHQAFLDLDRIEAVRGPQGTLYGRNATGGAINIISKRPTEEFEGSAQLGVGNYNEFAPQLILSGPLLGDRLLGRIAVSSLERDGYSYNRFNGKHYDDANAKSVRGSLLFNATDDVELLIIGDYHDEDDGNYSAHLLGTSPGFPVITGVAAGGSSVPLDARGRAIDPRQLSINSLPENKRHAAGVSAELTWRFNDELTFKSISGYRNEGNSLTFDFDSTTHSFPSTVPGKDFSVYQGRHQFSEELQLLVDLGWMTWVNGLYYYTDKVNPGYFWLGVAPSPASCRQNRRWSSRPMKARRYRSMFLRTAARSPWNCWGRSIRCRSREDRRARLPPAWISTASRASPPMGRASHSSATGTGRTMCGPCQSTARMPVG